MTKQQYFLNRPDENEELVYNILLQKLNRSFPSRWEELIENISFIMLKPNAYLGNAIPEILTELKANHIEVMEYKLLNLTENHLDNLYCFIKNKYANSWWVMQKVYSLAPCLVAIVRGDKLGYSHLSSRIRELVGSTTPIISNNRTLRYVSYSMTRVFNTIHATDDPASAIREALVFFSEEDLLNILLSRVNDKTNQMLNKPEMLLSKSDYSISFAGLKHKLKKHLVERASTIVSIASTKETAPITDSLNQLSKLLEKEVIIINRRLSLREEFYLLSPIYQIESICVSFIDRLAEQNTRNSYRKPNFTKYDQQLIETCSQVSKLINLLRPLSDNSVFLSIKEFESYISELNLLAHDFTQYDQTVLLGCWAGSFEEMRDISTKWPVEEIGT